VLGLVYTTAAKLVPKLSRQIKVPWKEPMLRKTVQKMHKHTHIMKKL